VRVQEEGEGAEPLAQISIVELGSGLLRHRHLIVRLAILGALVALGLNALKPRSYSSSAALMPQSSRPGSALNGIATQFGISLPANDPGQSPAFYLELINSTQLLSSLAASPFPDPDNRGASRPLVEILKVKGETPELRTTEAVLLLRRLVSPSVRPKTGVVDLVVRMPDPKLAAAVCTRVLELLNRFNLETRQSQAAAEARFVQARLADAKAELRVAEDRLQYFLQRNRDFRNSAELTFQQERLQRDVMLNQQIVGTLSQNYEQARIDQVRDTPAITVVERPVPPARADRRHNLRYGTIGFVLGLVLGVIWAWGSDFFGALLRRREPEIEEFQTLVDDSRSDLRNPLRFVWRLFVPRPRRRA
jgi:uncharacterized protein involved in exopolysaccharide biosynthesis